MDSLKAKQTELLRQPLGESELQRRAEKRAEERQQTEFLEEIQAFIAHGEYDSAVCSAVFIETTDDFGSSSDKSFRARVDIVFVQL